MRARLSYANVMSTLALFIALGGSSYAAVKLGPGVVKNRNLAKNSVTSTKVKNGTLGAADFKRGTLLRGPTGRAGAIGPAGPAGRDGATGATGPAGPPGPVEASANAAEGTPNITTTGRAVAVLGPSTEIPGTSGAFGAALTIPPGPYFMVAANASVEFAAAPPAGTECSIDSATNAGSYFVRTRGIASGATDITVHLNTVFPIFRPAGNPTQQNVIRVRLFCKAGSGTVNVVRAQLAGMAFDNSQ